MIKPGKASDYRDRDLAIAKRSSIVGGLSRFEILVKRIKLFIKDRMAAIDAVKEIRDKELWREKYESFDQCCLEEFGWQRSQSYSMLQAADVVADLDQSRILDTIKTPSQALALVPVKESKRQAVIDRARKSGKPLTAKRITAAIKPNERKNNAKPVVIELEPEAGSPIVIDVSPEPKVQKRAHDCPMCRCAE